nr:Pr6Pr family membrane protein [Marivita sp. S6314]
MSEHGETVIDAVWSIYRFFTIWTNTLIGFACARIASGARVSPKGLSGLLLSILIVASVYHALLASLNDYTGIDAVVDSLLHTIVPMAFALFWLTCVAKHALRYRDILPWLILPLVYCIYAMIRAQADGVYPYFFLNLANLGLARTALNVLGLLLVFAGVGALIVLVAKALTRLSSNKGGASA